MVVDVRQKFDFRGTWFSIRISIRLTVEKLCNYLQLLELPKLLEIRNFENFIDSRQREFLEMNKKYI